MDGVKGAVSKAWKDCVSFTKLFTSFCGVISGGIALVNAIKPTTLHDLPFTKSESAKQ